MTVAPPPDEIPLAPEPKRPAEPPPAVVFMADKPLVSEEVEVGIEREPVKAKRLVSLDVFRGITIAAMLIVNNPGDWGHKYAPLEHAEWHGWTPTDLIFPFFLFIVGVAIPFSFAKRSATESRGQMLAHVWSRALSLFLLGALLQAFPYHGIDPLPPQYTMLHVLRIALYVVLAVGFVALLFPWRSRKLALLLPPIVGLVLLGLGYAIQHANMSALDAGLPATFSFGNGLFRPSHFRIPGVLQRIGICYGVAATIALFAGWRTILVSLVIFCAAYSALMLKGTFPGHETGSITKQDNFARSVDVKVFDRFDANGRVLAKHTYGEYPDPEGIVSTLPAIGSVLLGILVGLSLRRSDRTNLEKCASLLARGLLVTIAGVLLGWWLMPINKKIWTPSFAVFTAGLGMLTLGAIFYIMDVKGRRAWALPFKIYGMNAIAAYVFSGIIVRILLATKVTDPVSGKLMTAWTLCQHRVADAVHQAGTWWAHALPHLPPLDTPGNTSLAFSLGYVILILLLMGVLYVFKVFLKV
jgi:predicted acyltransferase